MVVLVIHVPLKFSYVWKVLSYSEDGFLKRFIAMFDTIIVSSKTTYLVEEFTQDGVKTTHILMLQHQTEVVQGDMRPEDPEMGCQFSSRNCSLLIGYLKD